METPNEFFDRRDFAKLAAVLAAWSPTSVLAGDESIDQKDVQPREEDLKPLLENSLAPAIHFQAAPIGSAAYIERIAKDSPALSRNDIPVEAWLEDVPTDPEEIAFLPVYRLSALIRQRLLSPVDLTEIYLNRIKRFNAKLMCAVTVMEESARRDAKQAATDIENGDYLGPLHGIPWGVKDLFSTHEAVTTWGAKPFENRIIDQDAEVVVRLRKAGAILIAKLATGTFAQGDQWYRGQTRNPWNNQEGSSGSSAGPGSATAAGLVGFSIGTETRGSIVSPAKRCGISALRPTFGRVSRYGCMTLSWSMDKVGPMCRTIQDCALVFDVIHGADGNDPSTLTAPFRFEHSPDLSALKIGYLKGSDAAFLETLRQMGANPELLSDPPSPRAVNGILNVEAAAAFDDFVSRNLDEKMVRKVRVKPFRAARDVTALDYLNSQRRRFALMKQMEEYFDGIDLYVSPTGDVGLTNLTGHPAAIVPYTIKEGQPRCITLVGKLFADDLLLSVAHAYQDVTHWHKEHPRIEV